MPTTALLPLPDGLEITAISVTKQELQVRITSNRMSSLCPLCSTPSFAIHSYYRRKPLELPCVGQTVRLLLSVKKFFCRVASCPRKVFTERLPDMIEPSSRLTTRLRSIVQAICAAFNAKGGARLGVQLGIRLSRMTFLRSLLLLPNPPVGKVKAVGIDDFAWKRGKRYGTVIIDLETHDVLDLLPDREAESVKQWLLIHPEIEIVSRDRGGAYADGAAQGAPQAQQIADRWHLCKNLGDAVEAYLVRQKPQLPPLPVQESVSQEISAPAIPLPPLPRPMPRQHASQEKRERKQHVVDQVRKLHEEGNSLHTIAASLHLARNTVRRYLRLEGSVQTKSRPRKPTLIHIMTISANASRKDVPMRLSYLRSFRKKAITEGKSRYATSWLVCVREGLAWLVHPNMPKIGKRDQPLHPQESFVGSSPSEKRTSRRKNKVTSRGFLKALRK